jgi:hypothetical protein
LGHFNLLTSKLFVKIVEVQTGRRQFFECWWEDGSLKRGHWRFKLWWNQGKRLVLNSKSLIQIEGLRNKICIKLVKFLIEKRCEIFWEFIRLLKTRPQSIGKSCNIRDMMIFTKLWLVLKATF